MPKDQVAVLYRAYQMLHIRSSGEKDPKAALTNNRSISDKRVSRPDDSGFCKAAVSNDKTSGLKKEYRNGTEK